MTHAIVKANKRKKGAFEKLFLEGRPPVNVGVTSGGDLFGGTQVTFTDVLGDKQFNLFAASVSQYRTMAFSYINLSRRLQYAVQAYSQTQFFYGYDPATLYGSDYGFIDRDTALATQTARGGTHHRRSTRSTATRASSCRRASCSSSRSTTSRTCSRSPTSTSSEQYGRVLFVERHVHAARRQPTCARRPSSASTGRSRATRCRSATSTRRAAGNLLSRQTVDVDARYYMRLGTNGVLAFRARGYKSWGEFPGYLYFGGNSELRGYDYLSFLGNKGFFTNAELRFPIIEAALTPIGVVGGLRGVFFFNFGAAAYDGIDDDGLDDRRRPS